MMPGWPFHPTSRLLQTVEKVRINHNSKEKSMNHFSKVQNSRWLALLTVLAMACVCQGQPTNATGELTTAQPIAASGEELSWPRQFEDGGTKVSMFKPQIEKWEGSDFET